MTRRDFLKTASIASAAIGAPALSSAAQAPQKGRFAISLAEWSLHRTLFAKTITNDTEFCGGCFSPNGTVFFLNQQGERGSLPDGPAGVNAVTYAITGPFPRRR